MTFTLPKRFDASAAKGVDHAIHDENGNYYGTFRTSLFDGHSKLIQVEIAKLQRKQKNDPKLKTDNYAWLRAFVEICFHGWSDIKSNGKDVKFTKDEAFKLMTYKAELGVDGDTQEDVDAAQASFDWLRERILSESRDVRNYQGDPEAEAEEDAKN